MGQPLGNDDRLRIQVTARGLEAIIVKDVDPILTAKVGETMFLNLEQVQVLMPVVFEYVNSARRTSCKFCTDDDMAQLKATICTEFKICDPTLLLFRTRKQEIVVARQLLFTILKWTNFGSLKYIGSLAKMDHATVLHAIKSINNMLDTRDMRYFDPIMRVLVVYNVIPTEIKHE